MAQPATPASALRRDQNRPVVDGGLDLEPEAARPAGRRHDAVDAPAPAFEDGKIAPRREGDPLHDGAVQMAGLVAAREAEELPARIGRAAEPLAVEIGQEDEPVDPGGAASAMAAMAS